MTDPFDLQHFLDAQPPVYPRVLAELRRGPRRPSRFAPPAPFCRLNAPSPAEAVQPSPRW